MSSTVLPDPTFVSFTGNTKLLETPPNVILALAVRAEYGSDEFDKANPNTGYDRALVVFDESVVLVLKRLSRKGG
jgi:hypothetical protein